MVLKTQIYEFFLSTVQLQYVLGSGSLLTNKLPVYFSNFSWAKTHLDFSVNYPTYSKNLESINVAMTQNKIVTK